MNNQGKSTTHTAEQDTLIRRLRGLMDDQGMSARKLSNRIGANPSYVGQILSGKGGTPSAVYLRKMAQALGTTTDYLTGISNESSQPVSEVSFREAPANWHSEDKDGIPLVGSGYCDDLAVESEVGGPLEVERLLLEPDHIIRYITRPPALWAAHDAYAIYFHGTSMEPRFRQGDIGIVDPRRPPGPSDDVVVQLNDGNGGSDVVTVLVKELVRAASTYVELKQFNPERIFRIPRSQVARLHRIVPSAELFA